MPYLNSPNAEMGMRNAAALGASTSNKIAVSITAAGDVIGIGRTSVYDLLKRGELKSIKIGARRLVLVDSIHALAKRSAETA